MQKKKKSRKSLILRLCIFAFVIYSALMLVDMQISLAKRQEELKMLEQQYEIQRLENKELERQIAAGIDEEYITRVARDKLDYVYPDEKVFIDISGN